MRLKLENLQDLNKIGSLSKFLRKRTWLIKDKLCHLICMKDKHDVKPNSKNRSGWQSRNSQKGVKLPMISVQGVAAYSIKRL